MTEVVTPIIEPLTYKTLSAIFFLVLSRTTNSYKSEGLWYIFYRTINAYRFPEPLLSTNGKPEVLNYTESQND